MGSNFFTYHSTKIPFENEEGKRLSQKEKEKLYEECKIIQDVVVENGHYNKIVEAQRNDPALSVFQEAKISEENMERFAREHIRQDLPLLKEKLRDNEIEFDYLPRTAKLAVMDMQYNIGNTKFNADKWPNLFHALKVEDYKEAAKQSHRKDVNQERNDQIYKWFIEASFD